MPDFVHLHNHTHYSLLDAACTPKQLIEAAAADGHKAVALTDHGVMFGCLEFYNKAKNAGIKPILGFEAYLANGTRYDTSAGKMKSKKRNYFHLILLAKNIEGYKNLAKLTTFGHTEGFYYRPRIDLELLEKYHEGIIATTACIAGVVNAHVVEGDMDLAWSDAKYFKDLFGDDFYLELQHHNFREDEILFREIPKIASALDIKMIATNDVHYIKKEHALPHNVLLLIKDVSAANSGQVDIKDLRYRTPEMYFRTAEEMNKIFKDFPEALANTVEIADKCDCTFEKKLFMPQFPIPKESKAADLDEYLREVTYEGLKKRFSDITPDLTERIDFELGVIIKMGFSGYFLIVQDFVKAAKNLGVRVGPGRGSAAGSLVAYCLEITDVDPLPYDLLFERFLNPDRISMPDIDIDFSDDKREKVIEYVKQKYGDSSVAQIVTFGTLSSRAVLKDVGRVLGVPLATINQITSKIPVVLGKVTPLKDAIELPELKWMKDEKDEKIKQLIEYSLVLEGFNRNTSLHAAGVVIAPGDVTDYVPCYKSPNQKNGGADIATQYTMNELEEAGLLKMDFLGLRTLSIIENTLTMIETNHGIKIDIDHIDFNDPETYDIFSKGLTLAVFQFESGGMQEYLKQLMPKSLEEITAMNALYRPGPMENIPEYIDRKLGKKPIEYIHPLMEKSLNKTYGIIVYQEQVMQLARDVGGFTLGQADLLRRAMGKKKQSIMDEQQAVFMEGALKNGVEKKTALEIFDLIQRFAKYGFNKSHSLAYSYLAYQTAWLKAHYPAEFLAANMSAEMHDLNKIVQLIEEAKKFDIRVLPPDVNKSSTLFTADGNTILFGLAAIKNVGTGAVESIIEARKIKPFSSFFDFASRVDTRTLNKRTMESLVYAGAFDSLKSGHRAALFDAIDIALDYSKAVQESNNTTMDSLFGSSAPAALVEPKLRDVTEWTEKFRLEKEKEVINFYISGHPLNRYYPYVSSLSTLKLGEKESNLIGSQVRICGLITEIRTRLDKRQNTIAFVKIEDFTGSAEMIFWSKSYEAFRDFITADSVIMAIGKAESDGDNLQVVVEEVIPIEKAAARYAKGYCVWIDLEKFEEGRIAEFQKLCKDPESKNSIVFNVFNNKANYRTRYMSDNINIPIDENTVNEVMKLFGRNNVMLL